MNKAYLIALDEVGVAETIGIVHNPRILEYFQATDFYVTSDETPWCAAFVNWSLENAGFKGTRSVRARSFLDWGVEVSLADAKHGDVVVLSRGTNSHEGHVGFFAGRINTNTIHVLGGNQSNKVSIARYPISTIISIRRITKKSMESSTKEQLAAVKPPSLLEWIFNAPTLIDKISRVIHTAQTKNIATTLAALIALLTFVAKFVGLDISQDVVDAINAAALGIIGWFTGKQVVNPEYLPASLKKSSS